MKKHSIDSTTIQFLSTFSTFLDWADAMVNRDEADLPSSQRFRSELAEMRQMHDDCARRLDQTNSLLEENV